MSQIRYPSLQRKVVLPLVAVTVAIFAALTALVIHNRTKYVDEVMQARASDVVNAIVHAAEAAENQDAFRRAVHSFANDFGIQLIAVLAGDSQRVVAGTRVDWEGATVAELVARGLVRIEALSQLSAAMASYLDVSYSNVNDATITQVSRRVVSLSWPVSDTHAASAQPAIILVSLDVADLRANIYRNTFRTLALGGVLIGLFGGYVWYLLRRYVVAPLNEISQLLESNTSARGDDARAMVPANATSVIAHAAESLHASFQKVRAAEAAAKAATAAKSEFLARMSHEIRTPMNGVMGMLEALLNTKIEPEQADYLRTAYTSADRLLGLINDILDYSKIEAGKLTIEQIDFDLPQLVVHTVSLWSRYAEDKGVALLASVDPAVPQWVNGDPTRIGQVLTNLTSNALKFTERGSVAIRIDVKHAEGSAVALRFAVEDTGVGISVAAQANLFTAFMQADGSTSRRYGGTGLGLAICQQLVHLMGGANIGVTSEPGNGSRFEFALTLTVAAPVLREASSFTSSPINSLLAARGRVLIVDDNDTNRKVAQVVLARLGVAFDSANDGAEAIEKVKATRYALVLMDCHMPVVDGFEAAAAIRRWEQEQQLPRMPIVASSASAFAEDREKCFAAGMDDFLAKPLTLASVGVTLGRWMEMTDASSGVSAAVIAASNAAQDVIQAKSDDLFDHAQLDEMRALIGADFTDIVRQLNANSVEAFDAMNEAAALGDAEMLRHAAHKFKGSLGTIGAKAAADAAWVIESQGRAAQLDGVQENIAQLANVYRRSRVYLRGLTLQSAEKKTDEDRARAVGE